MLTSLLGHYNNFFFAAHLLDIAMGVKTLRTILSSVTHNGKQVLTATTHPYQRGTGGPMHTWRQWLQGKSRSSGNQTVASLIPGSS